MLLIWKRMMVLKRVFKCFITAYWGRKGRRKTKISRIGSKRSFSGCNIGLEMYIWTLSTRKGWVMNRTCLWGECSSVSYLCSWRVQFWNVKTWDVTSYLPQSYYFLWYWATISALREYVACMALRIRAENIISCNMSKRLGMVAYW
jgi:hypothetical protein